MRRHSDCQVTAGASPGVSAGRRGSARARRSRPDGDHDGAARTRRRVRARAGPVGRVENQGLPGPDGRGASG